METTHRSIFREEALLCHQHGQERIDVQPIAYTPRTIRLLWGILALIVIIGGLCGFARVPVSVAGQAVVVPGDGASTENASVLVVLPAAAFDLITPGDAVVVRLSGGAGPIALHIAGLDAPVVSPAGIWTRFPVASAAASTLGPSVVLPTTAPSVDLTPYLGSLGQANVEIGSRRIGAHLPVLGRLFGEE